MSDSSRLDVLQGTLDLLILQALTLEPNHGLGVGAVNSIPPTTASARPARPAASVGSRSASVVARLIFLAIVSASSIM